MTGPWRNTRRVQDSSALITYTGWLERTVKVVKTRRQHHQVETHYCTPPNAFRASRHSSSWSLDDTCNNRTHNPTRIIDDVTK